MKRNRIRCKACDTILESKSAHDYVMCGCPNQASTDGGPHYLHCGAVDLSLIEVLDDPEQGETDGTEDTSDPHWPY